MARPYITSDDELIFYDDTVGAEIKLNALKIGSSSAHKARHQNAGDDEIDVGGLSGELADDQPPKAHASDHEDGGGDEVDITGLVGHQYGKNLLLNPSFESYNIDTNLPDFWDLTNTPTLAIATDTLFPARSGNQITITGTGQAYEGIYINAGVANWLKVLPSTKYTISFDYKVTDGDHLYITVRSYNGAVAGTLHVDDATLAATSATEKSYTFTTDADADNLQIMIMANADGDICIVSHLKLEQGAIATPYIPPDRDRTCTRTEATNATPDPHIASRRNMHIITALGAAAEFQLPTGTIYDGDSLVIRILDNSTGRALTYNAIYRGIITALPNTTVADKTMYQGYLYNLADTKWDMVALAEED